MRGTRTMLFRITKQDNQYLNMLKQINPVSYRGYKELSEKYYGEKRIGLFFTHYKLDGGSWSEPTLENENLKKFSKMLGRCEVFFANLKKADGNFRDMEDGYYYESVFSFPQDVQEILAFSAKFFGFTGKCNFSDLSSDVSLIFEPETNAKKQAWQDFCKSISSMSQFLKEYEHYFTEELKQSKRSGVESKV